MHFEITGANSARRRRRSGREPLRIRAERNSPLTECDRRRGKARQTRGARERVARGVSEIPRRVEELSNCNSSERDANRKLCRTILSFTDTFEMPLRFPPRDVAVASAFFSTSRRRLCAIFQLRYQSSSDERVKFFRRKIEIERDTPRIDLSRKSAMLNVLHLSYRSRIISLPPCI